MRWRLCVSCLGSTPITTTKVVQHVVLYGRVLKSRKKKTAHSHSKHATHMCETRIDPEYRKKENQCWKRRRREERKKDKEEKLLRIPELSILSWNTNSFIERAANLYKGMLFARRSKWSKSLNSCTCGCGKRTKRTNPQEVVVYMSDNGTLRRAGPTPH